MSKSTNQFMQRLATAANILNMMNVWNGSKAKDIVFAKIKLSGLLQFHNA